MCVCMFICKCGRELSHLLHLLVLPHTSVSHEEVRVVLLAERNLLHGSFIQLGDQLRCEQQARHLTCSHYSIITFVWVRVCVLTTMHLSVQYSQGL